MRCLVMHHQHEGFVASFLFKPVESLVGNDVGNVTLFVGLAVFADELEIIVFTLPRQNIPIVESLHLSVQVNLSHHHGLVAHLLEDLLELRLIMIELSYVGGFAVQVAVFARE